MGQVLLFLAHSIIQAGWNQCFWFHFNWMTGLPSVNEDNHIDHESSFMTG